MIETFKYLSTLIQDDLDGGLRVPRRGVPRLWEEEDQPQLLPQLWSVVWAR